ncbi:MAG: DUF4194 domain-containing protein [Spirochaetaceae bacterium]|jgi:hypothetical protein|nr:DUF4194 domain-containing protein [Spirochaetaceae bacterium]
MNQDLAALSLVQELNSDDFERFKAAIRMLTSKTFIIRALEKERDLYHFTIRNISLFDAWFSCMDVSLARDESAGVIAFRGTGGNRLFFSREEICAVLVLRMIYEDKKLEVSLTAFPIVTIADFQQKYNAMTGEDIKKTSLVNVLRRLASCKLIGLESKDYADPEGLIQLYPSIPFSVNRDALDEGIAFLNRADDSGGEDAGGEVE